MSDFPWLDGVERQTWDDYPGSVMTGKAKKITLHTMEVVAWPGYQNGASLPTFSIRPERNECRQHVRMDRSARTLRSPGAPRSPNINAGQNVQVEIAGHAAEVEGYSDEWYVTLARWLRRIAKASGTPLEAPFPFVPYPVMSSVRVSWEKFRDASGFVGHQHAPGNDHGDPGAIWGRLGPLLVAEPQEGDRSLSGQYVHNMPPEPEE